jgi:hypothetical protein
MKRPAAAREAAAANPAEHQPSDKARNDRRCNLSLGELIRDPKAELRNPNAPIRVDFY